jgi:hypothetical protein
MTEIRVEETEREWIVYPPSDNYLGIPRDGRWTFDGNYEHPTFSPSVNEAIGAPGQSLLDLSVTGPSERRHVFIRGGQIEYLGDCTKHAGETHTLRPLTHAELLRAYPDRPEWRA